MKSFGIEAVLKRTDSESEPDELEPFLDRELQFIKDLLSNSALRVLKDEETGSIDVSITWYVQATSLIAAQHFAASQLRLLSELLRSVKVFEPVRFKLCNFKAGGEWLGCFVRFNPDTNLPMYTDD